MVKDAVGDAGAIVRTNYTSSSSHGVLFLSAAVSTSDRPVSRLVAFFHADERPIFSGFRSASIAHSQVSLGLPIGRFQSDGTSGLLLRLNDDDFHLVNCGRRGIRGAIFCRLCMYWLRSNKLYSIALATVQVYLEVEVDDHTVHTSSRHCCLSRAVLTQSASDISVQSLMSSIQRLLCLPRPLTPTWVTFSAFKAPRN